jgi:type VI secretion system protein ImpL
MLAILKRPLVVVCAGLLLISLFVWKLGPFLRFGERAYAPLGSPMARIIAIVVLAVCWGAWQWFKRRRARQAGSQLAAAVVNQARAEQPNADAVKLREQFEDAIRTLKQNRRGAHSLYELPWYVIIGAP